MAVERRDVAADVATLGDRALVAAMRGEERRALVEFYRRFRPVLLVAVARLGGAVPDGDALVEDVLTDAAVHFIGTLTPVPQSVAGYLVRGLRNRVLNDVRSRGRLAQLVREAADPVPDAESIVAGCSSEYARRASAGPGRDEGEGALSPMVARVAAVIDAAMTDEERVVATWLAHGVTQRQIAEWLGITEAAAAKRVSRLRARLRAVVASAPTLAPTPARHRRDATVLD
jgi:DNA-directed RNA polymerase specialized sigma24 family protein